MRCGKKQVFHKVFFPRAHAGNAPPASVLRAVGICRQTLDIAKMRQRQTHILFGDEVFHVHFAFHGQNFRAAAVAVFIADGGQLIANHAHDLFFMRQQIQIIRNAFGQFIQLRLNLADFQRRQPAQTHIQNGLRLLIGQGKSFHQPAFGLGIVV